MLKWIYPKMASSLLTFYGKPRPINVRITPILLLARRAHFVLTLLSYKHDTTNYAYIAPINSFSVL